MKLELHALNLISGACTMLIMLRHGRGDRERERERYGGEREIGGRETVNTDSTQNGNLAAIFSTCQLYPDIRDTNFPHITYT